MTLVDLLIDAIATRKKIDIIIGDGIDPMKELHDAYKVAYNDIYHRNKNKLYYLDKRSWDKYEHVRHYTTNARPTPAYDLVLHLARKGLLRSVITTNYDSTLDAMFMRFSSEISSKVSVNPVLNHGEWDYFGYCSPKISSDKIELWKIHGTLNYIFCRGCSTLLKCPDFILPFGVKEITDFYNHPISHVYIPGKASCCPVTGDPLDIYESLCGHYVHPTDWNIPDFRSTPPFNKIIDGAIERLTTDTYGLIILGFKGNRNYEVINEAAEKLDGQGVKWVMCLTNDQQERVESGPEHCHLRDIVLNNGGEFGYSTVSELAMKIHSSMVDSGLIDILESYNYNKIMDDRYIANQYWERMLSP